MKNTIYLVIFKRMLINPLQSLVTKIVQGEKDVLMETRFSLKISRAKCDERNGNIIIFFPNEE